MCEVVSRRASFMASAGIAALLKKMDYKVEVVYLVNVLAYINVS